MPKFEVDVSCAFSMKVSIEAEDEASAASMAEEVVASNYAVFGRDEAKHYPFEGMNSSVSGVIS
jgi:hypothetical protein